MDDGPQAEAAYDVAVAQYKETVLAAFQQVEDELALLRLLDQETALQDQAVRSSQQAEQLALNQYRAGTATYLAVVTAQTLSLTNQRTAVQLRGRLLAAGLSLVAATGGGWSAQDTPVAAAAERRAAAANANIGVAKAAYFPQLTLSANGGLGAAALGSLFDTPSHVWSLGAALAQTLFDGGLRRARTAQAEAAYDVTVAQYKETVLGAFQQVEDQLALLRLLDQETALQDQAVRSSQQAEQLALNQYRGGTAGYLGVVTAQTLSLANQRSAVQLRGRLLAASLSLVAATGGGWSADDTPAVAAATAPQ